MWYPTWWVSASSSLPARSAVRRSARGFLVSGFFIPLIVPADIPLWMLALAVAFAVIFGKEVFGGTGMNIWNPALLTRAFLFFSYPSYMSGSECWISLRKTDTVIDGFTGATLSHLTALPHSTAPASGISSSEPFPAQSERLRSSPSSSARSS